MVLFRLFIFLVILPIKLSANELGLHWGGLYHDIDEQVSDQPKALIDIGSQNYSQGHSNKTVNIEGGNEFTSCVQEIILAQEKYNIPMNLLLAIGLQESGRKYKGIMTAWPYTVNSAGTGKYFNTKSEAIYWLRERQNLGYRSSDVGCMQINLKWHGNAFVNLDEAFNPKTNVEYAAQHLIKLHAEFGNWNKAVASYHSRTPEHQKNYLQNLQKNILYANKTRQYFDEITNFAIEQLQNEENKGVINNINTGLPVWGQWMKKILTVYHCSRIKT